MGDASKKFDFSPMLIAAELPSPASEKFRRRVWTAAVLTSTCENAARVMLENFRRTSSRWRRPQHGRRCMVVKREADQDLRRHLPDQQQAVEVRCAPSTYSPRSAWHHRPPAQPRNHSGRPWRPASVTTNHEHRVIMPDGRAAKASIGTSAKSAQSVSATSGPNGATAWLRHRERVRLGLLSTSPRPRRTPAGYDGRSLWLWGFLIGVVAGPLVFAVLASRCGRSAARCRCAPPGFGKPVGNRLAMSGLWSDQALAIVAGCRLPPR